MLLHWADDYACNFVRVFHDQGIRGEVVVRLFFFRLSLKPVAQSDAFESKMPSGDAYTREGWIREYFSEHRQFKHRGRPFEFVPWTAEAIAANPGLAEQGVLVGWIARTRVIPERTSPDAGFHLTMHEGWQGALVIVDPSDHADGQKIAMQARTDIGAPQAVLQSLVSQMVVGEGPQPFSAQVFAIVQESSFWHFAKQHNYQIKVLTFDVAVPNMLGGKEVFKEELRTLQEKNNVNRVKTTIMSDGALDPRANNMDEVVDYTEQGAGQITAESVSGAKYRSRDHAKRAELEGEPTDQDFWGKVKRWLQEEF